MARIPSGQRGNDMRGGNALKAVCNGLEAVCDGLEVVCDGLLAADNMVHLGKKR